MARILCGEPAPRRIPAEVMDARSRAEALLAAARAEADAIRAAAEAAREEVRAAAEADGLRIARARAAAELAGFAAERDRRLAALAPEVARLGLEVARRLLGRELSADADAVTALAARALREARDRAVVTLRIAPADAPRIDAARGALAALLRRAPGLEVREDAALAPGDVVVETEGGRIDARIEAQLEVLERVIGEAP